MGIQKKKEAAEKQAVNHEIKVLRAHDMSGAEGVTIAFDVEVNGVSIYGCFWREGVDKTGKDYEMVSFPSHKGKDGKYYKYAYVNFSDADKDAIQKGIESVMDA